MIIAVITNPSSGNATPRKENDSTSAGSANEYDRTGQNSTFT